MDRFLIQHITILSLILGLLLGLAAPIPVVGIVMLFCVLLVAAPFVIVFLIMDGKLELQTPKDSIITGALIGFMSNLSFSTAYSIVLVILSKVFHYTPNFFLTAMVVNSPLWLIGTFIIFLGILCATTNAFTGFATYYIINFIRDIYEKKHPELKDLQDFTHKEL